MNKTEEKIFVVDPEWKTKYPGAKAGILVMENIENAGQSAELDKLRVKTESEFRKGHEGFSRENINEIPTIKSYNNYYKNFGKTYHVRNQVESVINGKSLSSGFPVLTAMFMAEVKNMLLTAGHDCNTLNFPVRISVTTGEEIFTDIRGNEKKLAVGDMMMTDGEGIISSIILGPDSRTKLTPYARNVLFAVYAPADIEKDFVFSHLKDIEQYVKTFSPEAQTSFIEVFGS